MKAVFIKFSKSGRTCLLGVKANPFEIGYSHFVYLESESVKEVMGTEEPEKGDTFDLPDGGQIVPILDEDGNPYQAEIEGTMITFETIKWDIEDESKDPKEARKNKEKKINTSTNPIKLEGLWNEGWALDLHTKSSTPIKDNLGNIITWDTSRPYIAEELYRLKYKKDIDRAPSIAKLAAIFLKAKNYWDLDLIIPMPPSDTSRDFQPVYEIAKLIGNYLNIPVDENILLKKKSTTELKKVEDPDERKEILKNIFDINPDALFEKNVLLFDDLYRSGATLDSASEVLLNKGKAKNLFVLTITKTRTKR